MQAYTVQPLFEDHLKSQTNVIVMNNDEKCSSALPQISLKRFTLAAYNEHSQDTIHIHIKDKCNTTRYTHSYKS